MKRVGFVGVGCISGIYLENITKRFSDRLEIAGVCDLIPERAAAAHERYGVRVLRDMYELFADPCVDIVLNITRPCEHYAVTKAALLAGKHVYSEKPLSPSPEEARELVKLAEERGLYLGGAPDTFLGAGIQTARKLIDDGMIGTPVAAVARMANHGPEHWHPDPEFFYGYGGGPALDMGPYYITALINLLGRVSSVSAMSRVTFPERPILSEPKRGTVMPVSVNTFSAGTLRFASGAIAQVLFTFDVFTDEQVRLEIYGSEGTLSVPDPNNFGGAVRLLRAREKEFTEVPLMFPYADNSRALGLCEMAESIEEGRPHRANCAQQLHVVEVLDALSRASSTGREVRIRAPFRRMPPMPLEG